MDDYPIAPTPFTSVALSDRFWLPRLETNRTVTIPAVFRKCEESGRVDNFRKAARLMEGPYVGIRPFEDTDVYKAIEGASYSLAQRPDPELDARLDGLIALIAKAQEPDGYLFTNRTIDPAHVLPTSGPERWSNLVKSHELYNCGHLYEAAAAHFHATGKRSLLDVALRSAELVRRVFGANGRHDIPGHPIIEVGLARLFRITGDRSHLESARFLLQERGHHETRPLYTFADNPGYCQDYLPVLEQRQAVGHAVRAVYLYCGMADVAALLPDPSYAEAIKAIWSDVAESKIYLSGGLGARHTGEAFGEAYELPNMSAYAETCAAIGSVMWNQRLFLLTGESKYYDVLEQTLFNGLLAGVSLKGEEYFYTNPLESDGEFRFNKGSTGRQPWFDVSCCPTNLSRFFPSLPGYLYATNGESLYVNLYLASRATVEAGGTSLELLQETDYPWDGTILLKLRPKHPVRLRLLLRIPGWAQEQILGGSLYRFERPSAQAPSLRCNGSPIGIEKGYAVVEREWKEGDLLELSLPMPVRKVICDERVVDNRGKAALQRGPIVYCVEGRDSSLPLDAIRLEDVSSLSPTRKPELLGGILALNGPEFSAIPYYAWANRGPGPMKVWLSNA